MGSNEEIRDGEDLPFLCECGDVGCEKCVPMTAQEYRELPNRWPGVALAPGHGPEHLRRSGRQRDG